MTLFYKDKMTSEEREAALMEGEPLDRIPFDIGGFAFNALNVGYSIYDWYADMQKAFDSAQWTAEQYGSMWTPFGGYPGIGPWEFGSEIKWPTSELDQCPSVEPAVSNEEETWSLELPSYEVLRVTGYLPYIREFAGIAISRGLPFATPFYCPWSTAGNIVGIDRLCKWSLKKPDLAHHLMRLSTDFLLMVHKILADEFGAENYFVGDSTASASNALISPRLFREIVLLYLIDYHNRLIEMGIPGILLHICGDQNANYEFYPEVPLTPLSMIAVSHEVDLVKASEAFPNHIIAGNVDPAIFQFGSPDQVYEACRIAIEKGLKHERGFVLSPGCELPPRTPSYNVWMMAKAVNDFGYY